MNLLIVNVNLSIGGGENSLVSFLNLIDYSKYNVDLLLLHPGKELLSKLDPKVNVLFAYENNSYLDLEFSKSLKNCIKDKKYNYLLILLFLSLVKCFGIDPLNTRKYFSNKLEKDYDVAIAFKQGKSTSFVANKVNANTKITRFIHGKIKYKGLNKEYYKNQYKRFDSVVTLNEGIKDLLIKKFEIAENKIKVLPDTVDVDRVINSSEEFIINRNTKYVFSTIGRIVPLKGFDMAIDVAEILVNKGIDDFKWYFIGGAKDKNYLKSLKELLKDKNLEKQIEFTGDLSNPFPYTKVTDIYLHTSKVESFSYAICEARILGKPVLATKTIGACNQVKPSINGELASIDDPSNFSDKLIYMLESNFIEKFKERNITLEFNNQDIMNEYYKLFKGDD